MFRNLISRKPAFFVCSLLVFCSPIFCADIDVTYIERTPRYDYDAEKNNPESGDIVTFHGHIINWSDTTESVEYMWLIDYDEYGGGEVELSPGQKIVITTEWEWEDGNHTVCLIADPYDDIEESSEDNNEVCDRTNSIIAGFWVEESVYDYFHQHQHELGIGANSWEDWIQRQMGRQNELYENAVWPEAPYGVLDRVRIDKIVIVPDGVLPLNGGLATNHPDLSDKTVDLMWGFTAESLTGSFYANHTSLDEGNAFYIERSLIHELGHARYLIDCYGFDVHNTESYQSVQIEEDGELVAGTELMPFLAWGEVLYYNHSGGVMTGPYEFQWSPYEAAALNLIAGERALCGNYNASCNIGVFLQDLPEHNHVRFVDTEGNPWVGAEVKLYRSTAGPGWYGKTIDNTADAQYYSDGDGYVHLPKNPFNPGGKIIHTYGHANSVFVFRVSYGEQVWYRFTEVSDYNMQYWAGNTEDAYYTIELGGDNYEDTLPPTEPGNVRLEEADSEHVKIVWNASIDNIAVSGYDVYRDGEKVGTVMVTSFEDEEVEGCNSYTYHVVAFDSQNRSGLSNLCIVDVPAVVQDADLNDDLIIDLADISILCGNWLENECGVWGDITGNGMVDFFDFEQVARVFNTKIVIDNWPMKQRDMYNTGRAYCKISQDKMGNNFFDDILWQKQSPQSPVNGDFSAGTMCFFSEAGPEGEDIVVSGYHWPKGIQGMDRHSGKLIWRGNTAGGETIGRMTAAFSNDGKVIYVTNDATDGELMAFETINGPSSYWHTGADTTSGLKMMSPTISPDGRIWLHSWGGYMYAGTDYGDHISQTWQAETNIWACYSDPALYEDEGRLLVISGGRTNGIKCWDGDTQEEIWFAQTGNQTPVDASVTIDPENGNIYVGAGFESTFVIGLNKNGEALWDSAAIKIYDWQDGYNNKHRAQSAGCLSHDGQTYYFQTNSNQGDGLLYAINTSDGSVKWSWDTNSKGWETHSSSPVVTEDGMVVVGNNENHTYYAIHDAEEGPMVMDTIEVDSGGTALSSATISADGILYLPLRILWTESNGDGDVPNYEIENVYTAFDVGIKQD